MQEPAPSTDIDPPAVEAALREAAPSQTTPPTWPDAGGVEPAERLCCYCGNHAPGEHTYDGPETPLCASCFRLPSAGGPDDMEAKLAEDAAARREGVARAQRTAAAQADPVALPDADAYPFVARLLRSLGERVEQRKPLAFTCSWDGRAFKAKLVGGEDGPEEQWTSTEPAGEGPGARVLREASEANPLHAAVEAHALAPIVSDAEIPVRVLEVGSAAYAVGHPGGVIGGGL